MILALALAATVTNADLAAAHHRLEAVQAELEKAANARTVTWQEELEGQLTTVEATVFANRPVHVKWQVYSREEEFWLDAKGMIAMARSQYELAPGYLLDEKLFWDGHRTILETYGAEPAIPEPSTHVSETEHRFLEPYEKVAASATRRIRE